MIKQKAQNVVDAAKELLLCDGLKVGWKDVHKKVDLYNAIKDFEDMPENQTCEKCDHFFVVSAGQNLDIQVPACGLLKTTYPAEGEPGCKFKRI